MKEQQHATNTAFPWEEATLTFHNDPFAVVADPTLTTQQKRQLLASWASDARAVRDAPALRQLDSGAMVEIDSILSALKRLDGIDDGPEFQPVRHAWPEWRRPRRTLSSRVHRQFWHRGPDDDDDPPPCAAAAIPRRPRPALDGPAVAAAG